MSLDLGVVTGSLSPAGGGLFQCMRIPTNLVAKRGARVSVYGLDDDQFEASRPDWTVTEITAFPISGVRRYGYSPPMMRALASAGHDLVHLHGIWFYPSYVAGAWQKKTSRPVVVSPAGMLDDWSIEHARFWKRIIRVLYEDRNLRRAATIHANSLAEARSIRKFGLTNPIAVIPNGVDLPDLSHEVPVPPALNDGRKTLLFLGRIHAKKGLKELVFAWDRARLLQPRLHDEWKIAIAGWDDGYQTEIELLVRSLRLEGGIEFIGPVFGNDKLAHLRHVGAFILPSLGEGMPMAVLEAMSFKLPVLMTPECNMTEALKAGAAFEISSDPDAMARTIVEVLGDRAALDRTGAAGRAFVEQHHSWPGIVDSMMELYGWLLGSGGRPSCVID